MNNSAFGVRRFNAVFFGSLAAAKESGDESPQSKNRTASLRQQFS
jgi:hypothetical protein